MAQSVQKITLSASRDIPFNKLVLSQRLQCPARQGRSCLSRSSPRISGGARLLQSSQRQARCSTTTALETGLYESPGRRPALPGARSCSSSQKAPDPDGACPLRRARCGDGHSRRRRLPRREHPARPAAPARPVPGLPDPAGEGPVRGGDRRRVLRVGRRGEAAAAAGVGLPQAAGRLRRGQPDARPADGVHRQRRSRAAGAGVRAAGANRTRRRPTSSGAC